LKALSDKRHYEIELRQLSLISAKEKAVGNKEGGGPEVEVCHKELGWGRGILWTFHKTSG
jgi:hypothetical protein